MSRVDNLSIDEPFIKESSKDECFRELLSRVELLVDNLFIDEPFIKELSKDECFRDLLSRVELFIDEPFIEDLSTDECFGVKSIVSPSEFS